jgi:Domain of unknown function (DUF222)/HNH endonuclease
MPAISAPVAPPIGAGADDHADLVALAATLSKDELRARMHHALRAKAAAEGEYTVFFAESNKREMFRDDGATSPETWSAHCFGLSAPTARSYAVVAEKSDGLPELMSSLRQGQISFDKVRAVVDVATPETDHSLCEQAKECSVRELVEVARTTAARARSASVSQSRSEHDGRYARFNDPHRTMTLQLPKEDYAQAKASVDAFAKAVSPQGENKIPLDQRRYDGFMRIMDSVAPSGTSVGRTSSGKPPVGTAASDTPKEADAPLPPKPFLVVAHVPLDDLVDASGEKSELAAELEHVGLIDIETVQRIACDAAVVVAVDDAAGHTMYEGRARRFPTGAQRREVIRRDRECRFPGCANVTFTNVHHIVPWSLGGGTDLDNLVLLCRHHHGVVHRDGWSMSGNPNEELTVAAPNGRVMVSRPSALWTRVTAERRSRVPAVPAVPAVPTSESG